MISVFFNQNKLKKNKSFKYNLKKDISPDRSINKFIQIFPLKLEVQTCNCEIKVSISITRGKKLPPTLQEERA